MRTLIISGNLGKDPETKNVSGTELTTFSVATKGDRKDDPPQWINVVLFGKTAEIAAKFLKKGSQVAITGQLSVRTYEKDGVEKTWIECKGDRMEFLGGGAPKAESDDSAEAEAPVQTKARSRSRKPVDADADDLPF